MSAGYLELDDEGQLVHHQIDRVGNNLTKTLMWCAAHCEPAWVYGDGSFSCWWEHITGRHQHLSGWGCGPEFHDVVALADAPQSGVES